MQVKGEHWSYLQNKIYYTGINNRINEFLFCRSKICICITATQLCEQIVLVIWTDSKLNFRLLPILITEYLWHIRWFKITKIYF